MHACVSVCVCICVCVCVSLRYTLSMHECVLFVCVCVCAQGCMHAHGCVPMDVHERGGEKKVMFHYEPPDL